jgi:hypothetical protein
MVVKVDVMGTYGPSGCWHTVRIIPWTQNYMRTENTCPHGRDHVHTDAISIRANMV